MVEHVIIAGAGGQGIILLGKVLAMVAIKETRYVTWFPSYGAEVRGGTAHCMVIISDKEISSPYIDKADSLIIMNEPSLVKLNDRIKPKGLLLINGSLIDTDTLMQITHNCLPTGRNPTQKAMDKKSAYIYRQSLEVCIFPFTDIAIKLGNIRVANMVALGCYLAKKKNMDVQNAFRVIEEIAPCDKKDLIKINKKALSCGMELIK